MNERFIAVKAASKTLVEMPMEGSRFTALDLDRRVRVEGPAATVYLPADCELAAAIREVLACARAGEIRFDSGSISGSLALERLAASVGGALGQPR